MKNIRKAMVYILLVAYIISVSMPVLPYVKDTLAHTFWLYQHISTVHYEHGQYHAHYESNAIGKQTSSEKNPINNKQTDTQNDHVIVPTSYCFQLSVIPIQVFDTYHLTIEKTALPLDDLPPKLSLI